MADLFGWEEYRAPAQSHSPTSIAAAVAIASSAETMRARVYQFIVSQQELGATDEEIQIALGMNPSTERPRRRELETGGLVKASHKTRKTKSGRSAVVWMATS